MTEQTLEVAALASRYVRGLQAISAMRGEAVPVLVRNVVEHLSPRGVRLYFGPEPLGLYMLILESDDAQFARETWVCVEQGELEGFTVPLPPRDGIFLDGLVDA